MVHDHSFLILVNKFLCRKFNIFIYYMQLSIVTSILIHTWDDVDVVCNKCDYNPVNLNFRSFTKFLPIFSTSCEGTYVVYILQQTYVYIHTNLHKLAIGVQWAIDVGLTPNHCKVMTSSYIAHSCPLCSATTVPTPCRV